MKYTRPPSVYTRLYSDVGKDEAEVSESKWLSRTEPPQFDPGTAKNRPALIKGWACLLSARFIPFVGWPQCRQIIFPLASEIQLPHNPRMATIVDVSSWGASSTWSRMTREQMNAITH